MNDEDDILGLNALIEEVGGIVTFTVEEQEEINNAGAKVLEDDLHKAIKEKHYRQHKKGKSQKHLADVVDTGTLEGEPVNGDIAVGFKVKDARYASIARMLNDGTKTIEGDNFYDEAVDESSDKVQEAQIKKIKEIMDSKGAGN